MRAPPKRRHFAAITEIPETRPSLFSDRAQLKKRRIPKEVRLNLLWARVGGEPTVLVLKQVWAAAHGLDVEFKSGIRAATRLSDRCRVKHRQGIMDPPLI